MIKAISVQAFADYTIKVTLEDGRVVIMDMGYVKDLKGPVVEPLKDSETFKKVFVRNGIVTWQSGYDIDPYYLVESGEIVEADRAIGS